MRYEMPICAFLAAILVLIPLPWHWRAKNIPTLSLSIWLFVSNIIYGVNSILWADNYAVKVPVWCDIVTKIQIGATLSLPACCLCLCIRLERIASTRAASTSATSKRRTAIFDVMMCWILPMIYMAAHYIVQGHRFDIVEDLGCRPSIYTSIPAIFIIWVPPFIAIFLTFCFGGVALHHFFRRRLTFARHLQNSNSAITPARYFRLMAMAITQMLWGGIVLSVNAWITFRTGLLPYTSWEDVHWGFSRVGQFPLIFLPRSMIPSLFFNWWSVPVSALIFFIFFGFGQEAVNDYRAALRRVKSLFWKPRQETEKMSLPSSASKLSPLPPWTPRTPDGKFPSTATLNRDTTISLSLPLDLHSSASSDATCVDPDSPSKQTFTSKTSAFTSNV
uniref:Rcb2.42 n=1 Tax=Coprinopsis cinerea TaxID=5346 RepID=Q9UVN3_COPCI|nr:Rcb2.42 [Coprinopsis cinerea]